MAVCVTLEELKCILPQDEDQNVGPSDAQLTCFIDDAVAHVEYLGIEDECGEGPANRVAKYLAAHLAGFVDPQQIWTETLEAVDKFSDVFKTGLDSTYYGNMAKQYDCTNQLANKDNAVEGITPRLIFIANG